MATLADIANGVESSPADENSRPNAFVSALAGIGSGLFKIPEGFVNAKNGNKTDFTFNPLSILTPGKTRNFFDIWE